MSLNFCSFILGSWNLYQVRSRFSWQHFSCKSEKQDFDVTWTLLVFSPYFHRTAQVCTGRWCTMLLVQLFNETENRPGDNDRCPAQLSLSGDGGGQTYGTVNLGVDEVTSTVWPQLWCQGVFLMMQPAGNSEIPTSDDNWTHHYVISQKMHW